VFTRERFRLPVFTGDPNRDVYALGRVLDEYLRGLEKKEALQLDQIVSVGFSSTGIIRGQVSDAASADQSLTNTTALTDVTDLSFKIGVSEEWSAQFVLDVGAALQTTGIKLAVNAPVGATLNAMASLTPNVITAANDGNKRTTAIATAMDFTAAAQVGVGNAGIRVALWVLNGTTAGTMQLQFAQSTNSATALTIRKGSFIQASRIA
jgi:hypothetical protein